METDIVRKCIADYLHKIDRYRQQRDELQGRIDATRRKIAWHEKRIIGAVRTAETYRKAVVDEGNRGSPSCGKWHASPRRWHGVPKTCTPMG
ncbi:hypothetical protein NIB75_06520 [Bacteroides uniformis]|nr:hypothetical protein [Bacteroides uniformis]